MTRISASLRGPTFETVLGTLLEPLPQSMQPAPKPNGGSRNGPGRARKEVQDEDLEKLIFEQPSYVLALLFGPWRHLKSEPKA